MMNRSVRVLVAFVVLFLLYQSAEGIGGRLQGNFAVQAGLMLACVLAAWPLSRWLGYRGYGAWALDASPRALGWLVAGLLVAVLAKAAALWAGMRAGVYVPAPGATPHALAQLLPALPMLLLSTFVPSIAEDILTRGFWYRAAGIAWRRGAAFAAFSAAMYVLNHVYRLANGPLEWLSLACFGLSCATALWRTGTLWAAVGLHWGWNLGNAVADHVLPLDVAAPAQAPLLSASMHLLMLVLVLLVTRKRPRSVEAGAADGTVREGKAVGA